MQWSSVRTTIEHMSTDRQGISAGEIGSPSYYDAKPDGHTRVCWSGAIGRASRGARTHEHDSEVIIGDALRFLADDPEMCICPKRKVQRRRR